MVPPVPETQETSKRREHLGRSDLRRSRAVAEAVLGATRHGLQVTHATRTGSLPADSLLTPLVVPRLGTRVTARSASCCQKDATETTYSCAGGGTHDGCNDGK